MTDKQIRDRIVGALSVSMMPIEMEAECIRFLNRCLTTRADRIRKLDDKALAAELYAFGDAPYCRNSEECKELLDQDKGIPEDKCIQCVMRYLSEPMEETIDGN